jgi:glyoxylase-like metal-dependent hydrolase (beta-lactamase superfamily II)
MATERWTVGEISITKIDESEGDWVPVEFMLNALPAATAEEIEAIDWLRPHHLDDGKLNVVTHSLLVETPTHKIVVDTGIGNGKQRISPAFELDTDYLERFESVWSREEVDIVLLTHLHVDHVGWNTIDAGDGTWVPTFPNARYVMVGKEFEHWKALAADPDAAKAYSEFGWSMIDAVAVFDDSIAPVEDAGLVTLVEADAVVAPGISLISTPGHSPAHVSVLIEDGGEQAVISGDLFHTQAQIARPEWWVEMDSDAALGTRSRTGFLERFADSPVLVIGTHFGSPTAGHLVRDGDGFKLVPERG